MRLRLSFLLLVRFVVNGNRSNVIVEVSKAISRLHQLHCLTVFHSTGDERGHVYQWVTKWLVTDLNLSNALQITFDEYRNVSVQERQLRRCPKTLNVVNGLDEQVRQEFVQFSKNYNLGLHNIWLLFLEEATSVEDYAEALILQLDVNLITATVAFNDNVLLNAPYRVSSSQPLRIPEVGRWSPDTGLEMSPVMVADQRKNLEGFVFRAGSLENPPITSLILREDGKLDIDGFFGHVWKELGARLNFSSEYFESVDSGTGSIDADGKWNGLIGMVTRGEIDVAISELTITEIRTHFVDFSMPLLSSDLQIFFKHYGNQMQWDGILRPFRPETWLVIVAWTVVAAILLANFYTVGCYLDTEDAQLKREFSVVNSFFSVFRALTFQGNPIVPKSSPCRAVYATAYLVTGVIVPSYSAALISYLTVQNPIRPFSDLKTLLRDGTYLLSASRRTAEYSYFSNATEPLLRQVYEELMMPIAEADLPKNTKEGIEFTCKQHKMAHYGPYISGKTLANDLYLEHGCQIMTLEEPVGVVDLTIGFVKDSPYRVVINLELQKMKDDGILDRIRRKTWPMMKQVYDVRFEAIEIRQVVLIHFLLLAGYFLGALFLLFEKFCSNNRRTNLGKVKAFGVAQIFFRLSTDRHWNF